MESGVMEVNWMFVGDSTTDFSEKEVYILGGTAVVFSLPAAKSC